VVTRDAQIEILRLLEENERGMSEFYHECAERFVNHTAVWRQLATEEDTHALMVEVIRSLVEEGGIDLGHRLSWDAVGTLARHVRDQLDAVKARVPSMEYAVVFADSVEHLSAESGAFHVHEGDPPELANLLHHLAEDSLRHARSIEELAAAHGGAMWDAAKDEAGKE
jgi:hypothetical protein